MLDRVVDDVLQIYGRLRLRGGVSGGARLPDSRINRNL